MVWDKNSVWNENTFNLGVCCILIYLKKFKKISIQWLTQTFWSLNSVDKNYGNWNVIVFMIYIYALLEQLLMELSIVRQWVDAIFAKIL